MQRHQNGVVTRCAVGIVAGVPNRVLLDATHDDDEPDVAGVAGVLDTREREWSNDFIRSVFQDPSRKVPGGIWAIVHI